MKEEIANVWAQELRTLAGDRVTARLLDSGGWVVVIEFGPLEHILVSVDSCIEFRQRWKGERGYV